MPHYSQRDTEAFDKQTTVVSIEPEFNHAPADLASDGEVVLTAVVVRVRAENPDKKGSPPTTYELDFRVVRDAGCVRLRSIERCHTRTDDCRIAVAHLVPVVVRAEQAIETFVDHEAPQLDDIALAALLDDAREETYSVDIRPVDETTDSRERDTQVPERVGDR